jgi:lipoprotein-releasing system permease protein
MFKYYLAFKYLLTRRITLASVAVTTLGVMVMLIVVSLITGYKMKVEEVLRGNTADLIIWNMYGYPIADYQEKLARIAALPEVRTVAPYIEKGVLVTYGNREYRWCMLKGIDPDYEMRIGKFSQYVDNPANVAAEFGSARKGEPPLILGKAVLTTTGVEIGASVDITTSQIAPRDDAPLRTMTFRVIGFTQSGRYDIDKKECYVPLAVAQEMIGLKPGQEVTHLKVELKNQRDLIAAKFAVAEALTGLKVPRQSAKLDQQMTDFEPFRIFTWRDEKAPELFAIDKDRNILVFLVAFIILGAGFVTMAILVMMVFEKRKDIGILKAVGCPWYGAVAVFLLMGGFIGLVGALLGWGAGTLAVTNINDIAKVVEQISGRRVFATEVYNLDKIPAYTDPLAVLLILAATVGVSVISSMAAAIRAASVDPVKALRYE